jgi:hypothetical protein
MRPKLLSSRNAAIYLQKDLLHGGRKESDRQDEGSHTLA